MPLLNPYPSIKSPFQLLHPRVQVPKLPIKLLNPLSLQIIQEPLNPLRDSFRIVPEVLIRRGPRKRATKGAHRVSRVRIPLPALRGIRLDDDAFRSRAVFQHARFVRARLSFE
ncbi:hypothetical protein RRF57_011530 [Xylaria bambusicola]|uniref:Uncharacterized protein n=1 Tax=Xylaria bambusicola TaxID=326684 RepID=A0AAN7UV35_9PEZI